MISDQLLEQQKPIFTATVALGIMIMCACSVPEYGAPTRIEHVMVVGKHHEPFRVTFNVALGIPETSPERWELRLRRPDGTETGKWFDRAAWDILQIGDSFDMNWP